MNSLNSKLVMLGEKGINLSPIQRLMVNSGAKPVSNDSESLHRIPLFGSELETLSFTVPTDSENLSAMTEQTNVHAAPLLLIYRSPAHAITESLVGGQEIGSATNAWLDRAVQLLHFLRANRESVDLVVFEQVLSSPAKLFESLNKQHGFRLDGSSGSPLADTTIADPVLFALAELAIQQERICREVIQELEASTIPLTQVPVPSTDEVLQSYIGLTRGLEDSATELREENDLLEMQLRQLRGELEDTVSSQIEHQTKFNGLAIEMQQLKSDLGRVQKELEDTLSSQMEYQTRLNGQATEMQQLKFDLGRVQGELDDRVNELVNISHTLSWRITAPLRWTLDRFKKPN